MTTCIHCGRPIVNESGRWIDPEATDDDIIWRETCDAHDTFQAEHEPQGERMTTPITGFKITLIIGTDDITDLLALGRKLREAEDRDGKAITTKEQAAEEVAWVFASVGTHLFQERSGLYAEIDTVTAEVLP